MTEMDVEDVEKVIRWIMERIARSEMNPVSHAMNGDAECRLRAFIMGLRAAMQGGE